MSSVNALFIILAVSLLGSGAHRPQQSPATPVFGYKVLHEYPHDPRAFTQGLQYLDGVLYEGTGLTGRSSLRKVQLETGVVLQQRSLADEYFGEGITVWRNRIFQLTYTTNTGFVYEKESFKHLGRFQYDGEGWGLTNDGARLIMSDGTPTLRFIDPNSLREISRLMVRDQLQAVDDLNELEFISGKIWANIWMTNRIAQIDPKTGIVTAWIDLTGLLSRQDAVKADVLNGIAFDEAGGRLFVTGKLWPKLYQIEIVPKKH